MPGKGSLGSIAADIQNIRKILEEYEFGFPILKELIQNADDAGAMELDIGWFAGFPEAPHPLLRGPLLFAANDGPFTKSNAGSLRYLGLSDKPTDPAAVGKFGIGLKSLFHLCEAFFFMGTDLSDPDLVFDIYNPWSSQLGSNKPGLHDEWDDAPIQTEAFISFLRELRLDGPWQTLEKGWFCLWVPLRKEIHCNGIKPISPRYPGDNAESIEELIRGHSGNEISSILPMLRNLHTVRIWKPS